MIRSILLAAAVLMAPGAVASAQRAPSARAIADSARREIEGAQLVGDTLRLDAVRRYLATGLRLYPNDPLLLHYAGYAAYRRLNLVPPEQDAVRVPAMAIEARDLLERSIQLRPMPESYAVLSSIIGRQIGYYPLQGDIYILAAQEATMNGLNLNSDNPRVWLMNGIAAFYTMPQHGGGYPVVEKLLRRAIRFFEAEKVEPPMPSWGHAEAYVWLGQALAKQGKLAEARVAYDKALQIEPTFGWVTYVLRPQLDSLEAAKARTQ